MPKTLWKRVGKLKEKVMKKKDGVPIPKPVDAKSLEAILTSSDTDSIIINGSISSRVYAEYSFILSFGETYNYILRTEDSDINFRITCGASDLVKYDDLSPGEIDSTFTVPVVKDAVHVTFMAADGASNITYNLTITKS